MGRNSRRLAALALSGTVLTPIAAHAQSAPPSSGATIQEVVVTAQKRVEKLVNVPIAVTALPASTLEKTGVTDMGSLAQVVPGMHIDMTGAFFQPSIRGVGTAVAGQGVAPSVATYVDGIYQPNPLGDDFDFIDVASVDVLKGPQGTLQGRNTTAGAILVTTRAPSFTPVLEASAAYGNYNTGQFNLFAADRITDKLAFSLAAGINASQGWITNIADNSHANPSTSYLVRGKLLWTPTDRMKFTLTFDSERTNDRTGYAAGTYNGFSDGPAFFGTPSISNSVTKIEIQPGTYRHIIAGDGFNLKSEFDLGFANLTSYSAAHRSWGYEASNEAASMFPANGTLPVQPCPTLLTCSFLGTGAYSFLEAVSWKAVEQTYSQEFDLNSKPGGPVDWVAGLYYFHDATIYSPENLELYGPFGAGGALTGALPPWPASSYLSFPFVYINKAGAIQESYSAFADSTYHMGDWHFTVGGRINEDVPGVVFSAPPNLANGFNNYPYLSAHTHILSFDPRVVVRYSLTPHSNVYVSASGGSKSAVYNASGFNSEPNVVKPESIVDVEGGYKLATGKTQLEISAFHYDYKNLQASTYANGIALIQNAAKSEMWGADVHWAQAITSDFRINVSAAYTHARYINFPNAVYASFSPTAGANTGNCANVGSSQSHVIAGCPTGVVNTDGVMERTPEWTFSVGADYTHDLWGGRLDLNGNYYYQTKASFDFADTIVQSGYGLLALRAGWTDPSGHWTVSVVGRNVTNTKYLTQVLPDSGGFGAVWGEPANFLAKIAYKY